MKISFMSCCDLRVQHHILLCVEGSLVFALQQPLELVYAGLYRHMMLISRCSMAVCAQKGRPEFLCAC